MRARTRPVPLGALAGLLALCAWAAPPSGEPADRDAAGLPARPGGDLGLPPGPVAQGEPRAPRIAEGARRVTPEIEAIELEAHVAFLASDALGGRMTGSEGERLASEYLAARLAEAGLAPAGDAEADGQATFFQDAGLVRRVPGETVELVLVDGAGEVHTLAQGSDFQVEGWWPVEGRFSLRRAARLADLSAAKDGGEGDEAADESRHALAIGEGPMRVQGWLRGLDPDEAPALVLFGGAMPRTAAPARQPRIERRATLVPTALVRLERSWLERAVAGEFESLEVRIDATLEPVAARNVLARLAGVGTEARPELAAEAIVLSAHYDHLGTRPAAPGEDPDTDRIFNGADDDASGVAAVLEIAEALALGPPPAREVIVLFATGEEIGLLGTYSYLDDPVVPLERTVLNLNFEMVGRPDPLLGPGRLWLTGDERTNLLGELVARGFDVAADPRPEQNFFRRSDNWAFARLGIVAQTLSSYGMHRDYHQVTDQWWTLDFEHMAAALVGALEIARLAAAGEIDPQWLPGGRPE